MSRFGITWQSLVMANCDPRDGNFCLYLTAMKDAYNLVFLVQNQRESSLFNVPKVWMECQLLVSSE